MVAALAVPRLKQALDEWVDGGDRDIDIEDAFVNGADFGGATRFEANGSRLEGVLLASAQIAKCEMTDIECRKLEAAALSAPGANLLRVCVMDSRCTGAEFGDGLFKDCVFKNVKFDQAGFRFVRFERVVFENCVLRQADFSNAKLTNVIFSGCDFEGCNFASAMCKDVDVSGQDITLVKSILGLKGATISPEQLIQLAPLLASELGFAVKDQT